MSQVGRFRSDPNVAEIFHLENTSGLTHTLVANGSPSFVPGIFGYGVTFPSTSDYLYYSGRLCDYNGPVTFLAWIKNKGSYATNYVVSMRASTYTLHDLTFTASALSVKIGATTLSASLAIPNDDSRHLVGYTMTSARATKLFYDGALVESGTCSNDTGSTTKFIIGPVKGGIVDEVGIWEEVKTEQWIRRYYAWATGKL